MLDFLRRSATSVFAWLILGALALVFGLQFGLPSDSLSFGAPTYLKVHGEPVGDAEFTYQTNLVNQHVRVPSDPQLQQLIGVKEEILESIVEREILAASAEDLGLRTSPKDAEDLILAEHAIVLGDRFEWPGNRPFDYETFTQRLLPYLRISEQQYLEVQGRELLAQTMRDLIASSVTVGEGEIRRAYEAQANRMSLRYARYSPTLFGNLVDPTEAQLRTWVAGHGDELKAQFLAQGARFAKLPKQARLWVMEFPKDADGKSALADAQRRLEAGEDFRVVARSVSSHDTAPRGGDFGWVSEASGTGIDPVVDGLLATLPADEVSQPLEGAEAHYLIRISQRREGDVPEADALLELAEEAVREAKGAELAAAAAAEDLAKLESGAPLSQVFSGGSALGTEGGIETDPPEPGSRPKVALNETGPFAKTDPIPGIGAAPKITEAAWAATPDQGMLDETFTVGQDVLLVGLVSKDEATDEGYAEARAEQVRQLLDRKGWLVTAAWTKHRCLEDKAAGQITVNADRIASLMTYPRKDEEGASPPQPKPYNVCDRVGSRGGLLRSSLGGQR